MRIAIIRLSALGDIINSALILQFIKKAYPKARIEWICEEAFAPVLKDHPDLHAVHTVAIKRAKKTRSLRLLFQSASKLRALGEFDAIIDLQGLLKSALVARLVGKDVHGFAKDSLREPIASLFYSFYTHIPYAENSIWRSLVLVSEALQIPITKEMVDAKKPALSYKESDNVACELLSTTQKNIAFVIGASWPSKCYPRESFSSLAQKFDANVILIWGSAAEREDALYIAQNSSARLAPKLSLKQLVALVDSVDLLIGNDTGPTHIAWAMNKPSITLFGPTPAKKMMWQTRINISLESDSKVDPLKLDRSDISIKEIPVELVYEKAMELLS
ncbi:MAG: lipopolysaccharide heptosyltransferase I [Campylobacterales bacterium]|nr:lipopolysaccharide heptosyltransferase I [Campylobacterales bacterium]